MAGLSPGRGGAAVLEEVVRAQKRGEARGIPSLCSAHPLVLQAAMEQALEDGTPVLIESTSNQVNQEGGYTGMRPADFVRFVSRLAQEAGLARERVILGGDHLGPHPWAAQAAAVAMARAARMVGDYVRAGYAKVHLDASMRCGDDPERALADEVIAQRTAELAAAAEAAHAEQAGASPPPLYVIGTEVPPPGGQAGDHEGPAPTRAADAERALALTRAAFTGRGLERAWERVIALVVQPGVEFGDDAVFPYRREAATGLKALAETQERLVYEAHSTDYQEEGALQALVQDHFAILKVGPELTFAFREAVFALEAIERELLARSKPERLSGVRKALDDVMRRDPRHWQAYYGDDDETQRLKRAFSLSDRVRYYWPCPEVQAALQRLYANLEGLSLPRGLVSQYLPRAVDVSEAGEPPARPRRLARLHVRRVLRRYARACGLHGRAAVARERECP